MEWDRLLHVLDPFLTERVTYLGIYVNKGTRAEEQATEWHKEESNGRRGHLLRVMVAEGLLGPAGKEMGRVLAPVLSHWVLLVPEIQAHLKAVTAEARHATAPIVTIIVLTSCVVS